MPTFSLPLRNQQPGITTIPSRPLPQGIGGLVILIARCTTDTPNIWQNASDEIEFRIDVSLDNEATWNNNAFVGRYQGGIQAKNGVEATHVEATFFMTPAPTHLRAAMEIIGGPIRTSMTFTTL